MGSRDMDFIGPNVILLGSTISRKTLAKFIDININPWQCMCIQP